MILRALAPSFLALSLLCPLARAQGFFPPGLPRPPKPNPAVVALRDYTATIHTTLGDMALLFYPDAAPNAVRQFIKLAQTGFYDGRRFYCVFKGRMILAGDPTQTATGGDGSTLEFETSPISHKAGTLALDRKLPDPRPGERANSASRFFISLTSRPHLDGDYTVFAEIKQGFDVAKLIGTARTRPNGGRPAPLEDIVIERIVITRKPEKDAEEKTKD